MFFLLLQQNTPSTGKGIEEMELRMGEAVRSMKRWNWENVRSMKITSVLDRRSPPLLPPVTISICLFQLQNILWVSDIKPWLSFMKYGKFVRCKNLCICHRVAATCMCKSTSDKGRQLLEFHLYLTVKSFINLILATILVDHSWYNCTFMRQ